MAEYSRIAKGSVVTSTGGGTGPIVLPFVPDRIEFINYTAMAIPLPTKVVKGWWDVTMGQGAAAYDYYTDGPSYLTKVSSTGGISTFKAGLSLQYGPKKQVVSTVVGSSTLFTVTGHGYVTGDIVTFQGLYQTATTGMPQIAGIPFSVIVIDANTFQINWDTSETNYTALSGSPAGATVMKVLYPWLYFPGVSYIDKIDLGKTTTVITTTPHRLVLGQEVAFRIPAAWGTTQLNSLPNSIVPGSPIYGIVQSVITNNEVIVNIDSSAFTPFNINQPVTSVPGQSFPQMVAVGDLNTGGVQYSGGNLYPSPYYLDSDNQVISTINGPAIQGAFVNNTSQGFIIGNLVAPNGGETIYWQAYLDDFVSP